MIYLSWLREISHTSALKIRGVVTAVGGIAHEKASTIGVMSEGGPNYSLHAKSCDQGHRVNLSNGRWRYAEQPGTDGTPVSSKQAQTSKSANKTLISLELVNNLIMYLYNGHGNSAEDII